VLATGGILTGFAAVGINPQHFNLPYPVNLPALLSGSPEIPLTSQYGKSCCVGS
jgi:hypothetical protein